MREMLVGQNHDCKTILSWFDLKLRIAHLTRTIKVCKDSELIKSSWVLNKIEKQTNKQLGQLGGKNSLFVLLNYEGETIEYFNEQNVSSFLILLVNMKEALCNASSSSLLCKCIM